MSDDRTRAKGADETILPDEENLFAEIDENGFVKRVIVVDAALLDTGRWGSPTNFVRTYTNPQRGRKNRAGIGDVYRQDLDAFVAPKPYPSWVLDENTATWKAPKPVPVAGKEYRWDEQKRDWEIIDERV